MNVDKTLNMAIPLPRANGHSIYIHAQPISALVFDQHFEIIAQTYAALFGEGYGSLAGPRVAAKVLRKIADKHGVWSGPMGVDNTLMEEIRRLTGVIMPPGSDTKMYLLSDAVKRSILTAKEADIIENALVFFTVVSAMQRPSALEDWLEAMAGMWGAQITSSNSTEFTRSLPTLTETDNSGETAKTT